MLAILFFISTRGKRIYFVLQYLFIIPAVQMKTDNKYYKKYQNKLESVVSFI